MQWLYDYFSNPNNIFIGSDAPRELSRLPSLFGLTEIHIQNLQIIQKDDLTLVSGTTKYRNYPHEFKLSVRVSENSPIYTAAMRYKNNDGNTPLTDIYPPAGVRLADDFYSIKHTDYYYDIYVTMSEIIVTFSESDEMPQSAESAQYPVSGRPGTIESVRGSSKFNLSLIFGQECPMRQRFAAFLPETGVETHFTGTINSDAEPLSYEVTGAYQKMVRLPYLNGVLSTTSCKLTLHSHVVDIYEMDNYPIDGPGKKTYMSNAYWQGLVDLIPRELPAVWLCHDLYTHGQKFVVTAEFEGGLGLGNIFGLLASLSGQSEPFEIPDWLSFDAVKLRTIAMMLQKEVADVPAWPTFNDEIFVGVSTAVDLTLPAIPIPFLGADGERAVISMLLQWDLLYLNPVPDAAIAFLSVRRYAPSFRLSFTVRLTNTNLPSGMWHRPNLTILCGASPVMLVLR